MSTKERRFDGGTRRARYLVLELGRELRAARTGAGLSQRVIAAATRMSIAKVSRIERGLSPRVALTDLVTLFAVVGLDLAAKGYPSGDPIRDEAHRRLLDRFVGTCSPTFRWKYEVPFGGPGDKRAWDAVGESAQVRVRVEAETSARDCQALQRKLALKRHDDPVGGRLILVLADTRANRRFVAANRAALEADYPIAPREMLSALRKGEDPGGDGYVVM